MSEYSSIRSSAMRPFVWSVRRELWENRWVVGVPVVVGATVLVAGAIGGTLFLPRRISGPVATDGLVQHMVASLDLVSRLILLTAFLVSALYCADAMHGERRDRSILFWRSVPVSDAAAVLAKLSVPVLLVPALTIGVLVAAYTGALLLGSVALSHLGVGSSVAHRVLTSAVAMVHPVSVVVVEVLWHLPVFAWLLLVSAAARRVPILWAVLPVIALALLERITIGSSYVASRVLARAPWKGDWNTIDTGGFSPRGDALGHPFSAGLLWDPSVWIGALIAAVFVILAVRLRRVRGAM